MEEMGKKKGKLLAAGVISMILLLIAGCSEKKQEPELKQALKPQFVSGGIRSVSLKKGGEEFLRISRVPEEYKMSFDYWEVLNPYDENMTVDTEAMFQMFEALSSLSFDTPVKAAEDTDTGLQDSDMGFTVDYVDTLDASSAQKADEPDTRVEVILGKEDGKGGRYAAVSGNKEQIYLLPEAALMMIYEKEPFDYLLKIPVLISADTLKKIEITAGGVRYDLAVDTKRDVYKLGKKEAGKKEFAALYQKLAGIMLVSETEGERRGEKEEAELTINFRRNTKGAPDVRVSYYPYDETYDSVRINGKEWFLVRREDVAELAEEIEKACGH